MNLNVKDETITVDIPIHERDSKLFDFQTLQFWFVTAVVRLIKGKFLGESKSRLFSCAIIRNPDSQFEYCTFPIHIFFLIIVPFLVSIFSQVKNTFSFTNMIINVIHKF